MENLTREELIESATHQGINLEEALEALGEGKPIKKFMITLSTGTEVLIVDNITAMWNKVKEMYGESI